MATHFLRGQFLKTRGARSFLSHLVSDPHAQNTFRAWLSAWLRIPRLADGAFESLNQGIDIVLRIIYGAVALDQKLSSRKVECVRNSAENANLGVLAPVFEAPGACQGRNEFPKCFAEIPHREAPSPTRFPRALPLRPEIRMG